MDEEEVKKIIAKLESGGYHIFPRGDIALHTHSPSCWCQPYLKHRDPKKKLEVWVHNFKRYEDN